MIFVYIYLYSEEMMHMPHMPEMLSACDYEIPLLLSSQIAQTDDPRYGGFMQEQFHVDPVIAALYCPG